MKQMIWTLLAFTALASVALAQEDIHQEDGAAEHEGQDCGGPRSGEQDNKTWKNTGTEQRHNQVYEDGELIDCQGREMKEHAIHAQESELWN
jgi:hypothetical protein